MQCPSTILARLRGIVTEVDCDASGNLTLFVIQDRLTWLVARDKDVGLLHCARRAFSRPDILFLAFHAEDPGALQEVQGWVHEVQGLPPSDMGHGEALDEVLPTALSLSLSMSQDAESEWVEPLPASLITPSPEIFAVEDQGFPTPVSALPAPRERWDIPVEVLVPVLKPCESPTRVKRADVERRRKHIKKIIANNLRDSFF